MQNFMIVHVLMIVAVSVIGASSEGDSNKNGYCDICGDHTLCQYKGLSDSCDNSKNGGVTDEEKKQIVDKHNYFRRLVANGKESRGVDTSQPKASDMLNMEWDDELAEIAQRWADQCNFNHDACRNVPRFNVGQNIYWNWRNPPIKTVDWSGAITAWHDEVKKFNTSIVRSYTFDSETGHYTQLVWHDSSLVGCGYRSYGPNKIYVCNYGPTGNWINEPIYNEGEPCANCPDGTTCDDGLCAKMPANEITSYAPIDEGQEVTDSIRILNPPAVDAVDYYQNNETNNVQSEEESTDFPVHLNIIDGLDIPDDEGIRQEIEELKKRIRALVERIALKKLEQI